jgi:hypothetical protein
MPKQTDAALGEFAFFKFLLTFYQQNKKRIRVSYRDLSKKFLDFNAPVRGARDLCLSERVPRQQAHRTDLQGLVRERGRLCRPR